MKAQSIIAGGEEQACRGAIARVRAEVEQEFAARLNGASLLSRARLRLSIRLEVARRMKRLSSPSNLYSVMGSAGWLAWPIIAVGLGAVSCQSAATPSEPGSSSGPATSTTSVDLPQIIEGRVPVASDANLIGPTRSAR